MKRTQIIVAILCVLAGERGLAEDSLNWDGAHAEEGSPAASCLFECPSSADPSTTEALSVNQSESSSLFVTTDDPLSFDPAGTSGSGAEQKEAKTAYLSQGVFGEVLRDSDGSHTWQNDFLGATPDSAGNASSPGAEPKEENVFLGEKSQDANMSLAKEYDTLATNFWDGKENLSGGAESNAAEVRADAAAQQNNLRHDPNDMISTQRPVP
jgi:hypothetical protein